MNGKRKSGVERRRLGWVWVWAAFIIFFVLEVTRLS